MGARTGGREAALKMLFGLEATQGDTEPFIALFWREFGGDPEERMYADEWVRGVMSEREAIDEIVKTASEHWRLERMTRVDRNVLRLGAWELKYKFDVPRAVALDEAIELAKKYGSEESGAFVNGVLNQVAENLGRRDSDR
jgi:N utilization substance protein B